MYQYKSEQVKLCLNFYTFINSGRNKFYEYKASTNCNNSSRGSRDVGQSISYIIKKNLAIFMKLVMRRH